MKAKHGFEWYAGAGALAGFVGAVVWRQVQNRWQRFLRRGEDLTGKTALVTGASSGIGAAYARRLAGLGYDVILAARRRERLDALAEEIRSRFGVRAEVLPADLTCDEDLLRLEKRITTDVSLEMLVNAAGFGAPGYFAEGAVQENVAMTEVHINATIRLCRAALPGMIQRRRGAVINVSSLAAFFPLAGNATYSASKAYLNNFSTSLQAELYGTGVRVQALCPGFTLTEFHDILEHFDRHSVPAFLWMKADEVVERSLNALGREEVIYIPGLANKLIRNLSYMPGIAFMTGWFNRWLRSRKK